MIGTRLFVKNRPVTCIHEDNKAEYYSFDQTFFTHTYDPVKFTSIINTLSRVGRIYNIYLIPQEVLSSIDKIFIPTKDEIEKYYWFKVGNHTLIKSNYFNKMVKCYWLSDMVDNYTANSVDINGIVNSRWVETELEIPIFFKVLKTKKEEFYANIARS